MKRSLPLVTYGSSDDEAPDVEGESEDDNAKSEPPPKKRKLPPLSAVLLSTAPKDNPALHQGRVRTTPHVEGQYAAYVYVPIRLERGSNFSKLLQKIVVQAQQMVSALHFVGMLEATESGPKEHEEIAELHISLSRPIYLRSHQREELRRVVKNIAQNSHPFDASFATFAVLENDERTRTFVTLEVGAGHRELAAMTDTLIPILQSIRQKEFYADPRFHASIAWALLSSPVNEAASRCTQGTAPATPDRSSPVSLESLESQTASQAGSATDHIFRIERLPSHVIPTLKNEFGEAIADRTVGSFRVDRVCVRIGRDVNLWKLGGD